jgi:hypothetical protein
MNRYYGGTGITLGSLLAVLISWTHNHSILWALIDFCFSWVYVIFAFLTYPRFI